MAWPRKENYKYNFNSPIIFSKTGNYDLEQTNIYDNLVALRLSEETESLQIVRYTGTTANTVTLVDLVTVPSYSGQSSDINDILTGGTSPVSYSLQNVTNVGNITTNDMLFNHSGYTITPGYVDYSVKISGVTETFGPNSFDGGLLEVKSRLVGFSGPPPIYFPGLTRILPAQIQLGTEDTISNNHYFVSLYVDGGVTSNQSVVIRELSGTMALLSDISGYTGNTLQTVTDNGAISDNFITLSNGISISGSVTGTTSLLINDDFEIKNGSNNAAHLSTADLTGDVFIEFPDYSGTFALDPISVGGSGAISFNRPRVYNTFTSPRSANITDDLTDAKVGIIQKIYHQSGTAPTFPAGWVLISGTYSTSVKNIIRAEWCEGTRVEYTITNL